MQSFAFASQHQDGGNGIIDFVVQRRAALIQAINPEAMLFQPFEGLTDVGHTCHRKMGKGACGGSIHGFRQRCAAAFRDHHAIRAGGVGGANNRSQIVRIFDTIQNHQQPGVFHIAQFDVAVCSAECNYTLVRYSFAGTVEGFARFKTNRYRLRAT